MMPLARANTANGKVSAIIIVPKRLSCRWRAASHNSNIKPVAATENIPSGYNVPRKNTMCGVIATRTKLTTKILCNCCDHCHVRMRANTKIPNITCTAIGY